MDLMAKTLVIGLGNPILSDDGVGVRVAHEVEQLLNPGERANISVTEASAGGLRLMEMMVGFEWVLLVDAILSTNGARPGEIRRMTADDLRFISPTQHSSCAHDTSLITALDLGREMGLPLPNKISIYAVEVANVTDFSDQLTSEVAEAVPKTAALILADLRHRTSSTPKADDVRHRYGDESNQN